MLCLLQRIMQKEGSAVTELSQKIFDHFQVRKTRKQKTAFVEQMQDAYPEMTIQQDKSGKNRNLILGNIKQAEVVFTAHYDTCAVLPFPNFIAPKNLPLSLLYSLLTIVPMIGILYLMNVVLSLFTANFWIHYIATISAMILLSSLMIFGPANKHTVNDNTSGVITLCEIYDALSSEEKARCAFVFFDNEESGMNGSSFFRKKHRALMKNKLLVNFDCVSDGDHILLAVSKKARNRYGDAIANSFTGNEAKQILLEKAATVYYPSDQVGFPNTIAIAALKRKRFVGLYMNRIHTKRDVIFDERNIALLVSCSQKLIQNIEHSEAL